MASAQQANGHRWSFGLTGTVKDIANVSAVALIAILLWRSTESSEKRGHEDRTMYREEMQTMHVDSQRKWEAINANQRAVLEMTKEIHGSGDIQQKAMSELTAAIKTLTEETRKLKDETKKSVPPGLDHRQGGRDG